MSTRYSSHNHPFSPWLFLLAGLLIGSNSSTIRWLQAHLESLLVSAYALLVVLYLTAVASRKQLEPYLLALWSKWNQRQRKYQGIRRADVLVTVKAEDEPPGIAAESVQEGDEEEEEEEVQEEIATASSLESPPINLSGYYRLVSNEGFEEFLETQGVPWALRRMANQARPTHRITHVGRQLTIKIEGIIESQTTYVLGGPPVETNVRGRIFEDRAEYLENNRGVIVRKTALAEEYDVTVQRELSDDKQTIYMTSTAIFRDGRPPVKSFQVFARIE